MQFDFDKIQNSKRLHFLQPVFSNKNISVLTSILPLLMSHLPVETPLVSGHEKKSRAVLRIAP